MLLVEGAKVLGKLAEFATDCVFALLSGRVAVPTERTPLAVYRNDHVV
jgi:hypothetical protein